MLCTCKAACCGLVVNLLTLHRNDSTNIYKWVNLTHFRHRFYIIKIDSLLLYFALQRVLSVSFLSFFISHVFTLLSNDATVSVTALIFDTLVLTLGLRYYHQWRYVFVLVSTSNEWIVSRETIVWELVSIVSP